MGQTASAPTKALSTGLAIIALALYKAYGAFFRETTLSGLPGPEKPHIFWGHQNLVWAHNPGVMSEKWAKEHGHVFKYNHLGNVCS
jgi:hypothetical protein